MFFRKTFKILFITCVCWVFLLANSYAVCPPDSSFLKDNPVAAQLDSLAFSIFFKNSESLKKVSSVNKYGFAPDSIPTYPDSIYAQRIALMNLNSPFEFVFNQQVKNFIELYSIKKRKLTSRMLGLGELYFPLFEEQLDIYDLPLELKYLPIIESALNPIARSRAGAGGLWQFMLNTGKLYGLKVTSLVDDRFDPYKSTVAACQHLKDLYDIYKDWALVLAAYNAGPGTINRAIRAANIDTSERISYWKIQNFLPRETQNYVPAFIAVCYLMQYAEEHNLYPTLPDITFYDIDTVQITQDVTFNQIASYLCIPIETIQFLNPAYRKGIIPATKENPYVVVLPRENVADFYNNLDAISKYKTLQEINYQNQLTQINQSKPQTQQTPTKASYTPTSSQSKTSSTQNYSRYIYHTVQKGDSLWSIAGKYNGVTVEEIRRLNNLPVKHTLYPGQKLKIGLKG